MKLQPLTGPACVEQRGNMTANITNHDKSVCDLLPLAACCCFHSSASIQKYSCIIFSSCCQGNKTLWQPRVIFHKTFHNQPGVEFQLQLKVHVSMQEKKKRRSRSFIRSTGWSEEDEAFQQQQSPGFTSLLDGSVQNNLTHQIYFGLWLGHSKSSSLVFCLNLRSQPEGRTFSFRLSSELNEGRSNLLAEGVAGFYSRWRKVSLPTEVGGFDLWTLPCRGF